MENILEKLIFIPIFLGGLYRGILWVKNHMCLVSLNLG